MEYVLSQICVCFCYIFLGLTYVIKQRNMILYFSLVALAFNGISYLLLGAWAGVGVVCIAVVRNILFLIQDKIKILDKYKIDDWIILIFLLVISIVVGFFTYDTVFSLFTISASMIYTVSVWQRNIKVYKILGVISCAFSVIYFIYIRSLFGFILETVVFITSLTATIIYIKNQNKAVINTKSAED